MDDLLFVIFFVLIIETVGKLTKGALWLARGSVVFACRFTLFAFSALAQMLRSIYFHASMMWLLLFQYRKLHNL
jgi:hypothetical protein